jgi:hypothetical protein
MDKKKPQPSSKIGAATKNHKRIPADHLPSKVLRHIVQAGLLALPTFNSPSHSALGETVTFYAEDTILRHAGSELQLRGSFRFILMNNIHLDARNSLFIPMHYVHRDTGT